jgi:hypothetical protein
VCVCVCVCVCVEGGGVSGSAGDGVLVGWGREVGGWVEFSDVYTGFGCKVTFIEVGWAVGGGQAGSLLTTRRHLAASSIH